jgi:hypothetical protein
LHLPIGARARLPKNRFSQWRSLIDGYKISPDDSDFHVVIKSAAAAGKKMIIEFPDAHCMRGSRVLEQATLASAPLAQIVELISGSEPGSASTIPVTPGQWCRSFSGTAFLSFMVFPP